ncbi:competence type IV pilus minor pilin ComGF [Legionella oakridgensis]|uniref:Prepilin-type N-terminal cleavage/methylation domain protein n=2 Tax=Legionella oakridgensis TaxID=29423 RepID=W0BIF0_9GAMM|nr:competence type IV pilus minor pilin ComGF [Legionella oakridgensis]AHE68387.1 prepilin-type N-terminal cleavage/methylation domain protein [Legionella oakridgensis ATCC 33761 = DSM 21215]ETO92159.1 prepilin-type N-terminal cleavage/methylation domain protein [Legionella oakridgensis RV-2-2007]KTD38946.1 hypothetical protein Loak_1067 [Legionella oakridgensis]STY21326.1 prepilin-type N-terminal cleavage/methylation domain [Legionella longbeachae]
MNVGKGFTLIEILLVIVLISIVAGIAGMILREGFRSYSAGKPIIAVAGKANIAADNLMREIQSAESLEVVSGSGLTFINQQGQTIVVDLNGTTLRRNVNGGGAQPLCTNVSSASFAYFNSGFASTGTASAVRFLTLSMTVIEGDIPYSLMASTVVRKTL